VLNLTRIYESRIELVQVEVLGDKRIQTRLNSKLRPERFV